MQIRSEDRPDGVLTPSEAGTDEAFDRVLDAYDQEPWSLASDAAVLRFLQSGEQGEIAALEYFSERAVTPQVHEFLAAHGTDATYADMVKWIADRQPKAA